MSGIDARQFRDALGSFVTGVTIVTARAADGSPVGLTVNSFNSVSLDPPLVLWSLALHSASLPVFRDAKCWAVHVLAAGQEELSARFATRGADKFDGLGDREGPEGAPLIAGYATRFGCEAAFEYEGGDHAIFVGRVTHLDRGTAEPLVYHGGSYARVLRQDQKSAPDSPRHRLAERGLVSSDGCLTAEGGLLLADFLTLLREDGAGIDEADRQSLTALISKLSDFAP